MNSPIDENETDLSNLLRYDLASMSVPGSEIELTRDSEGLWNANWERRDGERRSASFELKGSPSFVDVRVHENGASTTYANFLSSASMANLHSLARSLMHVTNYDLFVAPRCTEELNGREGDPVLATELLPRAVSDRRAGVTNLVFVTGGAGGGKTALIQNLVRSSASAYRSGAGGPLWLYVSAQGRRLAKLDDAVGRELGRMQAAFNYEAVTTLVRCGVLVLVIDGFDELLGIAGSYDESFSSLASFLDQLDGNGSVVAAARSVYYEEEFATRIDRAIGFRSEGWELKRIRLLDWQEEERSQFVALKTEQTDTQLDPSRVESLFSSPEISPLGGKPFFVTRAVDLLIRSTTPLDANRGAFIESLVNNYLDREINEKLVERAGRGYVSREQLRSVFSEIAEEMWRQDASELSSSSVRELVGVLADVEGLDSEIQLLLVDRAPYNALLKSGTTAGSVTFEHDVYFAYFLSSPIVTLLREGHSLKIRQALRRTQMSVEAADFAAQLLGNFGAKVLPILCEAGEVNNPWQANTKKNAGYVVAAILRNSEPTEKLHLHDLDFLGCDFRGVVLKRLTLKRCMFSASDLSETTLDGIASDVTFERCEISRTTTRLPLKGVQLTDFRVVTEYQDSSRVTIYSPRHIAEVLRACGLPIADDPADLYQVAPELTEAIQEAASVFARTNLFTEADDSPDVRRLTSSLGWDTLRRSLVDAELLRVDRRGASGRKSFLKVKVSSADLLAGQDKAAVVPTGVRAFWEALGQASSPN